MTVRAAKLPVSSALVPMRTAGGFLDCYYTNAVPTALTAREATDIALGAFPAWVKMLMAVRNRLVAPFGIKTGGANNAPPGLTEKSLGTGEKCPENMDETSMPGRVGIFKVYSQSQAEVILGGDDKHLDFRVSIMRHDGGIYLATWVLPHNLFGRIYLCVILPFHKVICRHAVARLEVVVDV